MSLPVKTSSTGYLHDGDTITIDTTSIAFNDIVIVSFHALDGTYEEPHVDPTCSAPDSNIQAKYLFKLRGAIIWFLMKPSTPDIVDITLGHNGKHVVFVSTWSGVSAINTSFFNGGGNFESEDLTYAGWVTSVYDGLGDSVLLVSSASSEDATDPHGAQTVYHKLTGDGYPIGAFALLGSHSPEEFFVAYPDFPDYVTVTAAEIPWVICPILLHGDELHTEVGGGTGRIPCPPLRHRQRDDIWEGPRSYHATNNPTSAGESERRGFNNTYDGPGPCFGGGGSCA